MEAFKVLIYGDGAFELSPHGEQPPAADVLVRRLLGDPEGVVVACADFKPVGHARVAEVVTTVPGAKVSAYARKVVQAITLAKLKGFRAVVILADRDRRPNAEVVVPLMQGRDSSSLRSGYPPCAIGVAVEAFDAWMIADGKAIKAAGGDAGKSHPTPENLDGKEGTGNHPKERAADVFGGQQSLGEKYALVAKHLDIDLLRRCCPAGFAPFADEVRKHLAPALQG